MHPLILLSLVLAGGGSGATVRAVPSMPRSAFAMQGRHGAVANNTTLLSKVMTRGGRVMSLDWTQTVPGIDGLGGGNNVFRVAVLVDGVSACHIDVACDAPVGDTSVTCAAATYEDGEDVDVRVVSQPCSILGAPSGFPAIDGETR